MALIIYRELGTVAVVATNVSFSMFPTLTPVTPGVRVWNNSCIHVIAVSNGANAILPTGNYVLVNQ